MPSLYSVLDIAKTALLTNEKAINVTSHNIANANTPGYSKQVADLASTNPVEFGGLFYGTGVTVQNVTRSYDSFLSSQLMYSNSSLSAYQSKSDILNGVQAALNDQTGNGLSTQLDSLFNSFQDLSNDPSSYSARASLLSNAGVLTQGFNTIDNTIRKNLSNINSEIDSSVQSINSIAGQIADLNKAIGSVEYGGTTANDLRDKRDVLLGDLSKIIDVKTIEDKPGQMNVYVAGTYLVAGTKTSPFSTSVGNDNLCLYNIVNNGVVLNSKITGGSLKGLVDGSQYIQGVEGKINNLAFSLTKAVDLQHRLGYGLDGSTNTDFFSLPPVYTMANGGNTGGSLVTNASIVDLSKATTDNYEIRFTGASSFSVVNTTTGTVVTSNGAYSSGNPITFDGLSVTISDNNGAPAVGDRFTVNVTENAAQNLNVAISDPNKIAAASSSAALPGDNTNSLALAGIKDSAVSGGSTLSGYYSGIVTDLGTVTQETTNGVSAQQKITDQIQTSRDSVSSVSIEEEAINLIKLQQAYQASAKVITTVNTMMDALMSIK